MNTKRRTITITEQNNEWIQAQIASGKFANETEYFDNLIRREQARQAEIERIRAALIEGEQSGMAESFDPEKFKQEMREKHEQ